MALPLLLATRADSDSDVPGGGSDPNGTPGVERLAWMAGEWGFERNGRSVTEIWMPPAGGTMLGMSRTVSGDKTVEYEFLLLRVEDSGDIAYVAKPSRQAETSFQLVRASETEAVFENLEHDFPQRILYILQPDGSLLAAIEGERNGETRRIEFPYQPRRRERIPGAGPRDPCPASIVWTQSGTAPAGQALPRRAEATPSSGPDRVGASSRRFLVRF